MNYMTFTRCQCELLITIEGIFSMVGIIKEVDKLGRVVIPKELRERFCLNESVEIIATEEGIVLRNPEYKLVKIPKEER